MNDTTIIIKTFLRVKCLERQLHSIEKWYPQIPIIICDDGEEAKKNQEYIIKKFKKLNIKYIITNNNIGLSEGRNILIDNVKTKYFVLCDDDFIFFKNTNLEIARYQLEYNNYDILGGLCLNAIRINYGTKKEKIQLLIRKIQELFKCYRKVGYAGKIELHEKRIIIDTKKLNYMSSQIYDTDICENFFIAKTEVIKKIRWTSKLKVNEHEDFFIRAKKEKVKIGVTALFKILHYPESYNDFNLHRDINYYKVVLENNNIKELKIFRNNVGIIQTYLLVNDKAIEKREYTQNLLGLLKKFYYNIK